MRKRVVIAAMSVLSAALLASSAFAAEEIKIGALFPLTGPAAVSGEDAVQGGPRRTLPDHRHVGPDGRFFNDQLSHVDAPFCLSQVSAGAEQTRSPEYFILALRP